MNGEQSRGRDALICLVCGGLVNRLDQSLIEVDQGPGWLRRRAQILAECEFCGTVRVREREVIELDRGDFGKRSLR